jgi:hypothetical protein
LVERRACEHRERVLTRFGGGQTLSFTEVATRVAAVRTLLAARGLRPLVILDGFHPSTFMRSVSDWGVTTFYCSELPHTPSERVPKHRIGDPEAELIDLADG